MSDEQYDTGMPRRCSQEHIRLNPAMYVGNTREAGLRNAVDALLRSSFEAAELGLGRSVRVHLHASGLIEIADDGLVPQNWKHSANSVTVETSLNAAAWGEQNPETGRVLFGYWVALALADLFRVEFRGPEAAYRQEYQRGELSKGLERVNKRQPFEFQVSFLPDPTIFDVQHFSEQFLHDRLRQLAFLHGGIRCVLIDPRGRETVFHYEDGIRTYVELLASTRSPLHPEVILIRGESEGIRYDIGLQWTKGRELTELSFVNGENVPLGGRHITGLRAALSRSLNSFIRRNIPGIRALDGDEIREGFISILSLRMDDPIWEGATRSRLHNEQAQRVVQSAVGSGLRQYLQDHPDAASRIVLSRDSCVAPLRPLVFDRAWRTSTVIALAQQMYDSSDFALMPILGDALEDAGCDSDDMLAHCRGDGLHTRACWAIDLVLGKD